MLKLTFFGAARAVTGSCHCVECGGKKILVDCGLQQGRDERDNRQLDFSAGYIDAVVVTHAHIDHSGRIPLLVKQGFQGNIYCTRLTGQLLLFATKMAMVKQVPAEEFVTNNRTVAATKLQEGDSLLTVRIVGTETDLALQSASGTFLRFSMEEIPELKKNSRGVRGMKLGAGDELEKIYFVTQQPQIVYKEKEVHLNRLKLAKRDGKGSKVRL